MTMFKSPGLVATITLCVLCAWTNHTSAQITHVQDSNGIPELKGSLFDNSNQMVQIHPWYRTSTPQKISVIYRTKTTTQVSLKFITKQTTYIKPAPTVTDTEYIAVTITDTEYIDADPITTTVTLTVPLVFTTTRIDASKTVTLTMPGLAHTVTSTVMNYSRCHQGDSPPRAVVAPEGMFTDTLVHIAKLQRKVADLLAVMSASKMRTNGRQEQLLGRLEKISWTEVFDSLPSTDKQGKFDWSIDQLDALKRTLVAQEMGNNSNGFFTGLEMFVNNLERMY